MSQEGSSPAENMTQQELEKQLKDQADLIQRQSAVLQQTEEHILRMGQEIHKRDEEIYGIKALLLQMTQQFQAFLQVPVTSIPPVTAVPPVFSTSPVTLVPTVTPANVTLIDSVSAGARPNVTFATGVGTPSTVTGVSGSSMETGKVPIKRENPNETVTIDITDSSEDSTSSSSGTDDVEVNPEFRQFAELLGRKEAPKPEAYDPTTGRSFTRFLESFEAYCISRYSKKNRDLWTPELGRYLRGEALMAFQACGGPEQKYRKIKSKLQDWYHDLRGRISSSRRTQYKEAKMQPGECLKIYATRLEHLFKTAYPGKPLDGRDLKQRLLETIPRSAVETLERDLGLLRTVNHRQNTWEDVLELLGTQDEAIRRSAGRWAVSNSWAGTGATATAMAVVTPPPQRKNPKVPRTPSQSPRRSWRAQYQLKSDSKSPETRPGPCNWCKRPGHDYDHCRRRLNLCLRCGGTGHFVANCPNPQGPVGGSSKEPEAKLKFSKGQGAIPKKQRSGQRSNSTSSSESDLSKSGKCQHPAGDRASQLNISPLV